MAESYIAESLSKDEKLIYSTRPHWVLFLPSTVMLIMALLVYLYLPNVILFDRALWHGLRLHQLATLFLVLIAAFGLLKAWIVYSTSEYGVTSKRVIMKQGFIQRYSTEIFLNRIEGINIAQSVTGRILGYGSLIIIGTGGTTDYYNSVPNPVHFRKLVQQRIV